MVKTSKVQAVIVKWDHAGENLLAKARDFGNIFVPQSLVNILDKSSSPGDLLGQWLLLEVEQLMSGSFRMKSTSHVMETFKRVHDSIKTAVWSLP